LDLINRSSELYRQPVSEQLKWQQRRGRSALQPGYAGFDL
jgi:hypothetical protein